MVELQLGSFRGVGFNFQDASRKSGRKSIFHTFPNSDIVLSEDLGRAPRSFTMNIFIHGTQQDTQILDGEKFVANNYYSRRDAIIEALEQKGPGDLVHPTYGTLRVQLEGAYTITESLREINKATIGVTFVAVDEADFLPTDTFSSIGIANASDEINEAVGTDLTNGIDLTTVEGWNSVLESVNDVIDFGTSVARFIQDFDALDALNVALRDLVTFYVPNLETLGEKLTDIFDLIEESVDSPRDTFNAFVELFDYNDDVIDALPPSTTQERITTANNLELFRQFVQTEALTHAINAAVDIEYTTDTDLETISDTIYDQQDKIQELPLTDSELYSQLQSQRVDFTNFVRDQQQAVLRVIEVPVRNESLSTLTYRYYGSLDNYQLLQNLNSFENPSLLNGTAKIVTNV